MRRGVYHNFAGFPSSISPAMKVTSTPRGISWRWEWVAIGRICIGAEEELGEYGIGLGGLDLGITSGEKKF